MIIGLIVNLIKKIIDLATSFVAWLFVTLGLWIPFVYSLVFVIVCALKGVSLSSVAALYFLGLFLSLFASVALSVYQVNRKFKRKNRRTTMQPGLEKRRDKVTLTSTVNQGVSDEEIDEYKKIIKQEKKAQKEKEKDENAAKKPVNILEAAREDSERKLKESGYMSEDDEEQKRREAKKLLFGKDTDDEDVDEEKKAKDARKILFGDRDDEDTEQKQQKNAKKLLFGEDDEEDLETKVDDGIRRGNREFRMEDYQAEAQTVVTRGGYNPSEMPRIFATRKDPTVFIYEYSNRIDFYKRTRGGMIYMYSEYKYQ
ncbi:MAG: hypothetical protein IJD07_01585 [Clostridia bacterium]|nr:hypothetical protein [Clostridia bacterium]